MSYEYIKHYNWRPDQVFKYTLETPRTKTKDLIRYMITVTQKEDIVVIEGEPTEDKPIMTSYNCWKHIAIPYFKRYCHRRKSFKVSVYHSPLLFPAKKPRRPRKPKPYCKRYEYGGYVWTVTMKDRKKHMEGEPGVLVFYFNCPYEKYWRSVGDMIRKYERTGVRQYKETNPKYLYRSRSVHVDEIRITENEP